MNFGFRRINGEEFEIALSKSAPNEIVGAALSLWFAWIQMCDLSPEA